MLVESLDDVKSEGDAKRILEKVKPSWVVWSAGEFGIASLCLRRMSRVGPRKEENTARGVQDCCETVTYICISWRLLEDNFSGSFFELD